METLTLFKMDNLMIKYNELDGIYFYVGNVRVNLFPTKITPEVAEQLAPVLKAMYERIYTVGHSNGYTVGYEKGKEDLQNNLKNLLNIKGE